MTRVLLFSSLFLAACTTQIDVTHYDQTCAQATDCAPVFSGNTCSLCACANAAVNRRDLQRYALDSAALRRNCGPLPTVECGPCPEPVAQCNGGRCELSR